MLADDVGGRVVRALGELAARDLLEALERSGDLEQAIMEAELAGVLREDTERAWLNERLGELVGESGKIARLRLIDELRRVLGGAGGP